MTKIQYLIIKRDGEENKRVFNGYVILRNAGDADYLIRINWQR